MKPHIEDNPYQALAHGPAEAVLLFAQLNNFNHSEYCEVVSPQEWQDYYASLPEEDRHRAFYNPMGGFDDTTELVIVYRSWAFNPRHGAGHINQPYLIDIAWEFFIKGWKLCADIHVPGEVQDQEEQERARWAAKFPHRAKRAKEAR